ncbi:MAG: tyrosine-type recombinase/integrase [Bacteroidetes bacterium]|nr:tyrosine-type recombinase/integrase [Bacteroidota bacterium]
MVALFKNQRKAVRTPRVNFYLEHRKDKEGKLITVDVPIIFSVSFGGRYKSFTGHRIDSDYWDADKQKIKAGYVHSARINKLLKDLKTELEIICYNAWEKNNLITSQYIAGKLGKNQQSVLTFFPCFDEYIEENKKVWASGTVTKFETIKSHLEEFGKKTHIALSFDGMDETFFKKLIDFYFDDKKFINSYVRKNLSFIKSFLIWAEDKGYNKKPDFRKSCKLVSGQKKEKTDQALIALEIKEFITLYNYIPKLEGHQRAKDYLILACTTGLRFSDIANLKKSDINFNQGYLNYLSIKTGERSMVPFNDFSREILMKYKDSPNHNEKGFEMAFPAISNQKTNKALKELAKDAGITDIKIRIRHVRNKRIEEEIPKYKLISTHSGRKTFVQFNMWLEVRSEITMGMTGHSDHKMMENYYNVNMDMKRDAMGKFTMKNLASRLQN